MSGNNLNTNSSNSIAQPFPANIIINTANAPRPNSTDLNLITHNLDNNVKINAIITSKNIFM